MANENQPLLHFGDEPEDINTSKNDQSQPRHIHFGEPADEPAKPAAKPVIKTEPVVTPQPVQQPVQTAKPAQPVRQEIIKPQPAPQQAAPSAQPKVTTASGNDAFGKKNMAINLIVVNGAGVVIPQFKIDHTVVKSGQEITFNDSRDVYEITVSADGYKERRVQITQTDLIKGEKRISLATQLQSFVVAFNTPDGIKRGSVDIDQTNAIYNYIKDASHTDTPLNELIIGGVGGHKPTPTKNSLIPYIAALIAGLLIGIGASALFNCSGSKEEGPEDKTEVVPEEQKDEEVNTKDGKENLDQQEEALTEESTATEEPAAENTEANANAEAKPEQTAAETTTTTATVTDADSQYLKTNDIWKRESATGDEAKKLLAAFCSGNINAIVNGNAYNNLPEKQRNGYYNKVLADLRKISTQSNVEDAKVALRECCSTGEINLVKILNRTHPMLRK